MSKEQKMITTPEEAAAAVGRDGRQLKFVPDNLKTPELCMQAVMDTRGAALKDVPERMRTPELCLEAVRFGGASGPRGELALQWVPDAMKTPELCMVAVLANGRALEFVPEGMKTPELCVAAQPGKRILDATTCSLRAEPVDVDTPCWAMSGFPFVPDALKSYEMCVAAVMACPYADALGLVPDALMTEELCIAAMHMSHGKALKHVPERLRTPDVLYTAERAHRQFEVEGHISLVG